ncbi:hypothetical protein PghCCS26_43220 [Paenibacillus glycanilyticus]|uniref:Uncharacterized protein n=1 Tax=Paenibacillus glycanilyticus TaxID=126569 RepID=A0ABQ6NSV4_9BACL|nr:hypothetical protein [Paenibacillus glycanilyticus]GMK47192.1 hypothetical protein PghCCS26_43220 [Paenibacillus glycanilyticus]
MAMLFDPTIFDNLKVALENQLYDLDNLDERIRIVNRVDRLDMAVMCREFALQFVLAGSDRQKRIIGEIRLDTSLRDLATELLELQEGEPPGCGLRLLFHLAMPDAETHCPRIQTAVREKWGAEVSLTQTLSFVYGSESVGGNLYKNAVELRFNRRIDEEQMNDLPELIEHMLLTLEALEQL